MLEKTLTGPLDCKEIQPVHPKGDQSWVFIGRTDAEAETPILWPPHAKSWLIGKDPDAGSDWGQEEKGTIEDEMAGWHHQLDAHEFGWTPGVGDGQGGLACCDSWGRKESDTTEWLNWTELMKICSLNLDFIKIVGMSLIILAFCYQLQSHSACHTAGLWIWKMRCWGREYDFIWKALKNGRLMSQSNHLVKAWMPGSFIEAEREREVMRN